MTLSFHAVGCIYIAFHVYIPKQQEDSLTAESSAFIVTVFCSMKKARTGEPGAKSAVCERLVDWLT